VVRRDLREANDKAAGCGPEDRHAVQPVDAHGLAKIVGMLDVGQQKDCGSCEPLPVDQTALMGPVVRKLRRKLDALRAPAANAPQMRRVLRVR
jgi:hypothetical protein